MERRALPPISSVVRARAEEGGRTPVHCRRQQASGSGVRLSLKPINIMRSVGLPLVSMIPTFDLQLQESSHTSKMPRNHPASFSPPKSHTRPSKPILFSGQTPGQMLSSTVSTTAPCAAETRYPIRYYETQILREI
jgi:hypothetical protein